MRLLFAILCLVGCTSSHFGTYPDDLSGFPKRRISPTEAVEAASPFLDESFDLCQAMRGDDDHFRRTPPCIRVKLQGRYYHVLKDNYPSMNANYGFGHAVRVDAETGDVTPPKKSAKPDHDAEISN